MKAKKGLTILLLGLTSLMMAACGGNNESSASSSEGSSSSYSSGESSDTSFTSDTSSGQTSGESSQESSEQSSEQSSEESSEDIAYYSGIDWTLRGAELKTALYSLISPHTEIGYDGLKTTYAKTDVGDDGYLVDMYSDVKWTSKWIGGNYSGEGDMWNREHIVPQSVFGSGIPKSDIFNVYPTDGYVNGKRSNYPHGEVDESAVTYTSGNGSRLGTGSSSSGYTGTVFEPIDQWKGDIARSYFYSVTCYQDKISNWSNNNGTFAFNTYPSLSSWAITLYLKWNEEDPVDDWERTRNERCYGVQNNRNPFIDHPEAASYIWG